MEDKTIIPLSLRGMFSCFPTCKPSEQDVQTLESIHLITPENWNPHSDMFQQNESCMLDWQGDLVDAKYRETISLVDIQEDELMATALCVSTSSMSWYYFYVRLLENNHIR